VAGFRSAEARGELFSLFLMGVWGLGAVFPKTPKTSQKKRFPLIGVTGFRGSAETCQLYFQAIYKNCRRIPLNGLSHVAISALIIGTIWLGIYLQPIFAALKR
jgi:hypothetical protein